MDDFPGLLARDFGFRPQSGKSAPMSQSRSTDSRSSSIRSNSKSTSSTWNSTPLFDNHPNDAFHDVFGGPPKYTSNATSSADAFDSLFNDGGGSCGGPVYDKPVYDDDIFDGVPGLKSVGNDVFGGSVGSAVSPPKKSGGVGYDDLFGDLGKESTKMRSLNSGGNNKKSSSSDFDDLLPGFGGITRPKSRESPECNNNQPSTLSSSKSNKTTSSGVEDPFVMLESSTSSLYHSSESFNEPLENISKPNNLGSTKSDDMLAFDRVDPFDGFTGNFPVFSSDSAKDRSPLRAQTQSTKSQPLSNQESTDIPLFETAEYVAQNKVPVDNHRKSHESSLRMPTASAEPYKDSYRNGSISSEKKSQFGAPPKVDDTFEEADDIWLTVSEIPLFTQLTSAPPPSRPPPPRPVQVSNENRYPNVNAFTSNSFSYQGFQSPNSASDSTRSPRYEYGDALSSEEEVDVNQSATASAAAKDAVDKATAKMRQAKEERKLGGARTYKTRESSQHDKETIQDAQERELREKQERQREEKERERKLEKEKERLREIQENDKRVAEKVQREARERAAADARAKYDKAAAEKALIAVQRAAVQRAQNEARARAAAEAKGRMERAAAEAKEREAQEAKEKEVKRVADARQARATAEKLAADKAAAEARERASTASRENQPKQDNDLDSFFGVGSRPTSAPKARTSTSDSTFGVQSQNKTSSGTTSNIRKAPSTTSLPNDLFGGLSSSSGYFQEIPGESDERRKARWERHLRTEERSREALENLNQRELQQQKAQEDRNRMAGALDFEIERWAAGKKGNLRALLSTLQYALWPECGWQPVSLTDLITGANVKKVYRKATLCIHPDKVQQKGATPQQKYIAEKVFDLLKEAWNKFNNEELF